MGILKNGTSVKYKILHNGSPLKKGYHNGNVEIWSAGNTVTYKVDSGVTYTEEVDYGASCLSPRTFTPAKAGWTFVGWRENSAANGTVLSAKPMGDDPITLYAVFKQVVTVTYYDDSTTPASTQANRYYNNASVTHARFSLTQAAKSGWTPIGWSTTASNRDGNVDYGTTVTVDSDITLYGVYRTNVTLYYDGNGADGGSVESETKYRYCTSTEPYPIPVTFTMKANGFVKNGYTFVGWSTSLTSTVVDPIAVGTPYGIYTNTTVYAKWRRATVVLFEEEVSGLSASRLWDRGATPNNGWGMATPYLNWGESDFNRIDCTGYNYCVVRITGSIHSTPSGSSSNHTYITIGFTTDYAAGISRVNDEIILHKWASDAGIGSGQEGLAHGQWYDLTIDVSGLTGYHDLNVFIGGAYRNGGTVYCSKITMMS